MKQISGYEQAETIKDKSSSLPKGAYEMKILGVTLQSGTKGDYLQMELDVAEGEFKDFFEKIYKETPSESKSWRCRYFVSVPNEDSSSEKEKFKLRMFKTFISHIEDSNAGYSWNWQEASLVNKRIGGLFVNNEFMGSGGQVCQSTVMARTCSVQDIIDGTYKMPKDRTLPKDSGFLNAPDFDSIELPFI